MKSFSRMVLGLVIALSAGWVWAAGSFEGEVDMTITSQNGKSLSMQYFVKGDKARSNMTSEDGKFSGGGIYNLKTKEMTVIMDKQKMYMVSQLHPEKFQYDNNKHFKVTKTGKTLEILGHGCQEWDYTSDDDNGKVWLTPGLGNWWGTQMAAQADKLPADQKAMIKMVVDEKLFPMKWESDDKSGNSKATGVVTKVEAKSLSSSLFEVPSGYKKLDMGNMFNGAGASSSSGNKDAVGDAIKSKLPF